MITRVMERADLGRVPVELDGAVRPEVVFQQIPVSFQDGNSAATVVIGTVQYHGQKTRRLGRTHAERVT